MKIHRLINSDNEYNFKIKAENIKNIDIIIDKILDKYYPIGSIVLSTNENICNESLIFKSAKWENIGSGRMIVGVDESNSLFSSSNLTGGEKNVTLTASSIPSHSHTLSAMTVTTTDNVSHGHTLGNNVGNHNHTLKMKYYPSKVNKGSSYARWNDSGESITDWGTTTNWNTNHSHNHSLSNSSNHTHAYTYIPYKSNDNNSNAPSAHNNLPPYKSAYIFKRIS